MSRSSRILVAAAVAPLAPAALFVAFSLDAAFIATIYSYIVFAFLGLPTILVLRHFGKLTIFSLVISGAVIGVASFLCFSAGFSKLLGSPLSEGLVTACAWGGVLGMLVAGCFGAIVGLHNLRTLAATKA